MKKLCIKCKNLKDESLFLPRTKEGWFRQPCKKCHSIKMREYRSSWSRLRRRQQKEYDRLYCLENKERLSLKFQEWKLKVRIEVLTAYSRGVIPECSCCGEKEIKFLAIDHVNGGGKRHGIKLNKRGISFYVWLKKNNYPKGYQTYCHNCNLAKGFYGECPHKKSK